MKGTIDGKDARKYANRHIKKRHKEFDKFILDNVDGGKVADFACGPGNVIALLLDKADEIYGLDASEEMIRICKEKFGSSKKVKLHLTSVTKTQLKSDYFDYVIIRMGLHHIENKKAVVDEMYRILKKGGKAIVIDRCYTYKYLAKLMEYLTFRFPEHFLESQKYNEQLFSKFKVLEKRYMPQIGRKRFMFLLER